MRIFDAGGSPNPTTCSNSKALVTQETPGGISSKQQQPNKNDDDEEVKEAERHNFTFAFVQTVMLVCFPPFPSSSTSSS